MALISECVDNCRFDFVVRTPVPQRPEFNALAQYYAYVFLLIVKRSNMRAVKFRENMATRPF